MSKFRPRPAHFEHKSQIAPNSLVFHNKMSDSTKLLLLALNGISSCAPGWVVVQSDLQNRLNWGRAKMQKSIREAVYFGYLKVTQARQKEGKKDKDGKFIRGQFAQNEFEFDLNGGYEKGVDFKPSTVGHLYKEENEEPQVGFQPPAKLMPANRPLPCSYDLTIPKEQTNKQPPKPEPLKKEEPMFVCSSEEEKEKRRLLKNYDLTESAIVGILKNSIEVIRNAIAATEQRKDQLANVEGFLLVAIKEKWSPNYTKKDKEKEIEKEQTKQKQLIEDRKKKIYKIIDKYSGLLLTKLRATFSDLHVEIDFIENRSSVNIYFNEEDCIEILEHYMKYHFPEVK